TDYGSARVRMAMMSQDEGWGNLILGHGCVGNHLSVCPFHCAMNPFPPCGGRLGRGVMQRRVSPTRRFRECAPDGALPPFQLRLSSLRSLSLRILPPQGGRGASLD